MYCIKKPSVRASYEELVKEVLKNGEDMITEDGQKCREIRNTVIEITNPKLKSISPKYPLGKKAVEQYTNNLLYGSENVFSYDYHSRLFKYPVNNKEINQIDFIVEKLKEQQNSRRCVAITWQPNIDIEVSNKDHGSVPCLQFVQFLIRDNKLYQTVLFRSNDLAVAFVSNALGLIALGEMVAEKVGVDYGTYTHHSVSMHIYIDRDRDYIEKYFPESLKYLE
ncbi:thymidylate synthase [Methanococcus aeolicus]|uniref:Putative thymidylate synthase n=1 Tax=Methanococcus aeolicus (strain ATCC BAA-1280 / DSM 17508 / OCM 812 / Nankai-3) TaxID=419665 RepID=A6UVV5_META3|nr:thymidylate synthase [Methanococcus aeolicus]ABR56627.1 thymidylate synthase [Methanococcus aeolicus Nankai-3]UXM84630.1 thymidylate synthase [Methanococcus aeolicus]